MLLQNRSLKHPNGKRNNKRRATSFPRIPSHPQPNGLVAVTEESRALLAVPEGTLLPVLEQDMALLPLPGTVAEVSTAMLPEGTLLPVPEGVLVTEETRVMAVSPAGVLLPVVEGTLVTEESSLVLVPKETLLPVTEGTLVTEESKLVEVSKVVVPEGTVPVAEGTLVAVPPEARALVPAPESKIIEVSTSELEEIPDATLLVCKWPLCGETFTCQAVCSLFVMFLFLFVGFESLSLFDARK